MERRNYFMVKVMKSGTMGSELVVASQPITVVGSCRPFFDVNLLSEQQLDFLIYHRNDSCLLCQPSIKTIVLFSRYLS